MPSLTNSVFDEKIPNQSLKSAMRGHIMQFCAMKKHENELNRAQDLLLGMLLSIFHNNFEFWLYDTASPNCAAENIPRIFGILIIGAFSPSISEVS